jgi:hypothetical protein
MQNSGSNRLQNFNTIGFKFQKLSLQIIKISRPIDLNIPQQA